MGVARAAARGLARVCEVAAALILVVVASINLAQVIGRYFVGTSIPWAEEIMRYVMIWLMMLGGVACFYRAEHMAVDALLDSLPVHLRRHGRSLLYGVAGIFCVYLVVLGWPVALRNTSQLAAASGIPMALPYLAIPIGGALMLIQIVLCWVAGYEPADDTMSDTGSDPAVPR